MSQRIPPVTAPRLAGAALRTFTSLAERPLLGAPLRRAMLKSAGIPAFRGVPATEAAIVVPPLPLQHPSEAPCELRARDDDSPAAERHVSPLDTGEAFLRQYDA